MEEILEARGRVAAALQKLEDGVKDPELVVAAVTAGSDLAQAKARVAMVKATSRVERDVQAAQQAATEAARNALALEVEALKKERDLLVRFDFAALEAHYAHLADALAWRVSSLEEQHHASADAALLTDDAQKLEVGSAIARVTRSAAEDARARQQEVGEILARVRLLRARGL